MEQEREINYWRLLDWFGFFAIAIVAIGDGTDGLQSRFGREFLGDRIGPWVAFFVTLWAAVTMSWARAATRVRADRDERFVVYCAMFLGFVAWMMFGPTFGENARPGVGILLLMASTFFAVHKARKWPAWVDEFELRQSQNKTANATSENELDADPRLR